MFIETEIRSEGAMHADVPAKRPASDKEFEDLLKSVRSKALSLTWRRTHQEDVAHDIVQDSMVALTKYRLSHHSLDLEWLHNLFFHILKIETIDYFNRNVRRKKRETLFCEIGNDDDDGGTNHLDFLCVCEETAVDLLERKQLSEIIQQKLKKLTPRQREAILTSAAEGRSLAETSKLMGISYDQTKRAVNGAKRKLSVSLQGFAGVAR